MTLLATFPSADPGLERLSIKLRHHTARAHKRTERAAGLSAHSMERGSLVAFLENLSAFQSVHEDWLTGCGIDREFLAVRRRASAMREDLAVLGHRQVDAEPYGAPMPEPSAAEGFGVLYVLEGSRAGGRHIDQWARGKDWYPDAGLRAFRGDDDGLLWRETQAALDTLPAAMTDGVLGSAERTFQRLEHWFARERP